MDERRKGDATGNSPCLQFMMVSAFLASPKGLLEGWSSGRLPSYSTGRATTGMSDASSSGDESEKIDAYVIHRVGSEL
jgi:hypothetical protein